MGFGCRSLLGQNPNDQIKRLCRLALANKRIDRRLVGDCCCLFANDRRVLSERFCDVFPELRIIGINDDDSYLFVFPRGDAMNENHREETEKDDGNDEHQQEFQRVVPQSQQQNS